MPKKRAQNPRTHCQPSWTESVSGATGTMWRPRRAHSGFLLHLVVLLVVGSSAASATPQTSGSPTRAQQCREGCLEKFASENVLCQQNEKCLTCWEECSKGPPPKISKSIWETWSLHTVSMLQQDSLVLVDVAWAPLSTPNQCLVTWEVAGGGLMGNLLTESSSVQLSLWPDTKYRVQVTCKNKLSGSMSRSLPLTIDTAQAEKAAVDSVHQQATQWPTPDGQRQPSLTAISTVSPTAGPTDFSNENVDTNVVPYEEQSAESIDHHTNFIFNWHMRKNGDISSVEPLHKSGLNILTIAALSDIQRPLLFGLVAGTVLLAFILLLYVCMMRHQHPSSDKAVLISDDFLDQGVSVPPTMVAGVIIPGPLRKEGEEEVVACKHPATCSRFALKV